MQYAFDLYVEKCYYSINMSYPQQCSWVFSGIVFQTKTAGTTLGGS